MTVGKRFRKSGPRVFCISIPKSGTHLLERILCHHSALYRKLLPTIHNTNIEKYGGLEGLTTALKAGQVLMAHLKHSEINQQILGKNKIKTLFLIRDPRDMLVSRVHYILNNKKHQLHYKLKRLENIQEQLSVLIVGSKNERIDPYANLLNKYIGWLDEQVHLMKFEDLIGARGGGDDIIQCEVITAIFDHLSLDISDNVLKKIVSSAFFPYSPTFRKGKIGQWKMHFNEELKKLFKENINEYLLKFQYEHDDNW
jgi:hypothetical protein